MARVTVEDCVERIPNRFDLVMLAAQRSRDISSGAPLTLDRDNDKNPVVALREIADETVDLTTLGESLIQSMQKQVEVDEPEEDNPEFDLPSLPVGEAAEAGDALIADALSVDEEEAGAAAAESVPEEELLAAGDAAEELAGDDLDEVSAEDGDEATADDEDTV